MKNTTPLTVMDVLGLLPRSARRQTKHILNKPHSVAEAVELLTPVFAPHAETLGKAGIVAQYACYAIANAVYRPGTTLEDYHASQQVELARLQTVNKRLESEVNDLQNLHDRLLDESH